MRAPRALTTTKANNASIANKIDRMAASYLTITAPPVSAGAHRAGRLQMAWSGRRLFCWRSQSLLRSEFQGILPYEDWESHQSMDILGLRDSRSNADGVRGLRRGAEAVRHITADHCERMGGTGQLAGMFITLSLFGECPKCFQNDFGSVKLLPRCGDDNWS
jgi:hypothetical protein